MGLYLGELIIKRILASEIWGGLFSEFYHSLQSRTSDRGQTNFRNERGMIRA